MPAIAASGQVAIEQGNVSVTPSSGSYFATTNTQVNLATINSPASNVDQNFNVNIPTSVQALGIFLTPTVQLQKLDVYGLGTTRLYRSIGITNESFYMIPWANVIDNVASLLINNNGVACTLWVVGYYNPPSTVVMASAPFNVTPRNTNSNPLYVASPSIPVATRQQQLTLTNASTWVDDASQFSPSSHIITLQIAMGVTFSGTGALVAPVLAIAVKGVTSGIRVILGDYTQQQQPASGVIGVVNIQDRIQLLNSINPNAIGLSGSENWCISAFGSLANSYCTFTLLYGVD